MVRFHKKYNGGRLELIPHQGSVIPLNSNGTWRLYSFEDLWKFSLLFDKVLEARFHELQKILSEMSRRNSLVIQWSESVKVVRGIRCDVADIDAIF